MPLSIGTRLGPYEILAPLGAGGMGEVYRARDPRLSREVAIKVLPERLANDPQALARFEREAKAVAALSHPNILAIHDFGSDAGIAYAVTELLEGETLRSGLSRAALAWRKAVETGIAIADGLSAAHSKGIVHRDLKPENIFLTKDGRVKILDFGLARSTGTSTAEKAEAETVTEEGVIMGTVGYMSPEQVRGTPADARSDIFSLGCVLYEMVAGRRAFSCETSAQTLAAILEAQPDSAGKQVPASLENVIAHCLEKNPQDRFHSSHDLALALRATLGGAAAPKQFPIRWVACLAVIVVAAAVYWFAGRARPIDSLAVMPFVNVGADPNTEYLSDGITENLINNLSQLPKLRVLPRSRVFRYKGRETDTEKIGRELNVRAVLTGRVVQRGDSLNIQTELVDVAADSQIWGRQYNRKFSEIIPVQEEIAKEVADKLHLRPTGEEQKRLTRRYTENPEAHQLYLRGRYYWNRRTGETLQRAVEYFQQAIGKDPAYALAWAGLADSYAVYSSYGVIPAPSEANPRAKEAASKALVLDEKLAEAHAALGFVKTFFDWDWPGAERELKRAINLNPNYASAHSWYGNLLEATGRRDEAVAETKRALDADPLSLITSTIAARTMYFARRYDQAIDLLRKTLEMDPNFVRAHWHLSMAYEQVGRNAEALAEGQKAASLAGGEAGVLGILGHAYAVSGKSAEAHKVLAELKDLSKQRYVVPFDFALIYAGLGDKSQALEWLEEAYEDRSPRLTWIKVDPRLDSLRGEPRFQAVLRRMGLQ